MVVFFTKEEKDWLRSITPDFMAYDWKDALAKEWRKAMLPLFFCQFPYRHPRFSRHCEHPGQDIAHPMFGDNWRSMPEVYTPTVRAL